MQDEEGMKTILITGCSSGIGLATVKYFAERGWNVAATMRSPEKDTQLRNIPHVKLYRLDVTDQKSIQDALEQTIKDFGSLDVIVNNAGYGAVGPFEGASQEQIKREFDTNLFAVMNITRAILPYFRKKQSGTIINISSIGGRMTFPLYSLYHGSKWGLEGFSESLQYELRPFNIKIKLVEPGPVKTDFYTHSMDIFKKEEYEAYAAPIIERFNQSGITTAPEPESVAKTIFKAATDPSFKLRYISGGQAHAILFLRWLLPYSLFSWIFKKVI